MKLNNCQVILPTFYPGKKIINCINSIPDKYPIAIIDNGNDDELGDILKKIPRRISHYKVGDIGLPKSFNFALSISNSNYIFITQPDVILEKNCIENLLIANFKYADAGILCPPFFMKKKIIVYMIITILNLIKKISNF